MHKTLLFGTLILAGTLSVNAWNVPGKELSKGKGPQILRNGRYFGMVGGKKTVVSKDGDALVIDMSKFKPKQVKPFFIHAVTPNMVMAKDTPAETKLKVIFKVDISCEKSPIGGFLRLTGEDKNKERFNKEVKFKPTDKEWTLEFKISSSIKKIGGQIKLSAPGIYRIKDISITTEPLK